MMNKRPIKAGKGQARVLEVLNKPRKPGQWITRSWKLDQDDDGEITKEDLRIMLEEVLPQFEQLLAE